MKKIFIYLLTFIISFSFGGCKEVLKTYETNENSKYINEETHTDGEKSEEVVTLNEVKFISWTGTHKIILSFNKENGRIPYHTISYNEEEKEIRVSLENVVWEDAVIGDYSKNEAIKEFMMISDPKVKSSLWIGIKIDREIVYRIDEDEENYQIIINLKNN